VQNKERLNMDKDNYIITVCPSCKCTYRVAEAFLGRKVSCKKCGADFSIDYQDERKQKNDRQDSSSEKGKSLNISKDDSYLVIGKLAVKYKFVNDKQIQEALSIQEEGKRAGQKLFMGETMVAHGMISQAQLDFLLSVQKALSIRKLDGKFGTIAVKNDFAAPEEIDRALQEQKKIFKETKTVKLIGDILVESKVLTENQRDTILKGQNRFKKITSAKQKKSDVQDSKEQIKSDVELNLTVSEDKLNAFISIKKEKSGAITVENIKNNLQTEGIEYGIVDDVKIAEFLNNNENKKGTLKIAEGKPPEPGKDAYIKYHFETDPLKVGEVKKGGSIDFKDKGDIPHVKEGDLLAEKIPVMEGRPGKDVYGSPIPPQKPEDMKLKPGKGAKISDDRLQIIAKIGGIPEISTLSKVFVSPQLKISGDVGLKTGHVDFDGKINVSETIQNGFRVKGNSLTAKEILWAEIEMTGDIVVYGGIIGATIKTGGNIRAMYMRESNIEAYGDVVIEKEVIDSKIDTSGACIVKSGSVLSSTVVAKKGIQAINIGSEISKPCNLTVGVDERIKNEIDKIKEAILLKKEEHKEFKSRLEEIKDEPEKVENKIAEMAQVQDKLTVKRRDIENQIEELEKEGNKARIADAEAELSESDSEMKTREEDLEKLFDRQDQLSEEISDIQKKISDSRTDVKKMKDKIADIFEWSDREKGIPEVRVNDTIFADTTINGFYSLLKLTQNQKCVLIKEDIIQSFDDRSALNHDQEKTGSKISIRPL